MGRRAVDDLSLEGRMSTKISPLRDELNKLGIYPNTRHPGRVLAECPLMDSIRTANPRTAWKLTLSMTETAFCLEAIGYRIKAGRLLEYRKVVERFFDVEDALHQAVSVVLGELDEMEDA